MAELLTLAAFWLLWVPGCVVVGIHDEKRHGRDAARWYLISMAATPLVGWLLLARRPAHRGPKRFRLCTWCGTCGNDAAVVIWGDKRVAGPCCEPRESS